MSMIGNGVKQNRKEDVLFRIILVAVVAAVGVVSVKRIFIGLDIDEQYAVAQAYRIAKGDLILKEVWEPHQTSALLTLLPIWIFMKLMGSCDYLLVFLRTISVLIQSAVALFWFGSFKEKAGRLFSLISAFLLFLITPKYILSPEFNNMQVWFFVIACLFILKGLQKDKARYFVPAGVFLLLEILAYPSCAILFAFMMVILFIRNKKYALLTALPVVAGGTILFVVFCVNVGISSIPEYAGYVLGDEAHSTGFLPKVTGYLSEIPRAFLYMIIYAFISAILCLIVKSVSNRFQFKSFVFKRQDLLLFLAVWNIIAFCDQFRSWRGTEAFIAYPQYCYLIMFISAWIVYFTGSREFRAKWKDEFILIEAGNFVTLIAVMMLTNLNLKATFIYLIPGCALFFLLLADSAPAVAGSEDVKSEDVKTAAGVSLLRVSTYLLAAVVLFVSIYGAGFIVRTSYEGRYSDMTMEFKKIENGPAKHIYCEYLEGFALNEENRLMLETIPKGSKVLYLGTDNLIYMAGDYEVCTPSTISTPVYGQNLKDYFSANPQKKPDYIVVGKRFAGDEEIMKIVGELSESGKISENEYIEIWR